MPAETQTVFTISEGDTFPPVRVKAYTTDDNGNEVVLPNLVGAVVKFSMVNEATDTVTFDGKTAAVEDAVTGVIRYSFDGTQRAGVYWADFDVLHQNGDKSTVPNNGRKIRVVVTRSAISGD